jgi:hypothetical protein
MVTQGCLFAEAMARKLTSVTMEEKNVTNDIVCQSMFIIMGTSEKVNIV